MAMIVAVALLIVLGFLMYYAYCVFTGTKPFWDSFFGGSKDTDTGDSTQDPLGYCTFDGRDLYEKRVYTKDGKRVSVDVSPIKCSECTNYVYEGDDGCVSIIYDTTENININDSDLFDQFCDPAHPERNRDCIQPHGTCTASLAPAKKCSF